MRYSGRGKLTFDSEFTCDWCRQTQPRHSAQQRFCNRTCWKSYQDAHSSRKRYAKVQHKQGVVAKALEASCQALEAQCTVWNQDEWPAIIRRFRTPHVSGYRDLTWLTKACVSAKLRLTNP